MNIVANKYINPFTGSGFRKIFLVFFLIFSFENFEPVFAQTKYSNLVKKGEYERAAKLIDKKLSKKPGDILLNYEKANLLINRRYANYDPIESFKYWKIARRNWDGLNRKKREKFNKIKVTALLQNCLKKINECAYIDATRSSSTLEFQQKFLDFLTLAPANYIASVTERRNASAYYQKAFVINTEESFQEFIDTYPDALQIPLAIEKRDILGFNSAKEMGTADAFRKFILKYPKSEPYNEALEIYSDLKISEYGMEKSNTRDNVLDLYKEFTKDGEKISMDLFFEIFSGADLSSLSEIKEEENLMANLGEKLNLYAKYDAKDFQKYDEYIRLVAPREKAFVALQRMISADIDGKKWHSAIDIVKKYLPYWGEKNTKILDLISILEKEDGKPVKIVAIDLDTNASGGSVYNPIHLSRTNTLYFSGKNRDDNMGGEDIFEAAVVNSKYEGIRLAPGTSSKESNEAPLNISADGLEMLMFRDGKIVCLERTGTSDSWHETSKYAELNDFDGWVSDAMLANGGKALLFASNMPGGKNLHQLKDGLTFFHGDMQYQSDIYVIVQDSSGLWGKPINLGDNINTPYSERTPFLHHDNKTLYFSSDGHGGLGRMDVYRSVRLRDDCWDCWSVPVNMGKEINTSGDDVGFKITEDGKKAYFSKDKSASPPSSLLLLLDVSGSMKGQRIEALKQATKNVCITGIRNNAEISILTFDGSCNRPISSALNFTKNYNEITSFIDKIVAKGNTPMYEAYSFACAGMKRYSSPDIENKVIILMTDGEANGCANLENVLNNLKNDGLLYKTQTIGFDVDINSVPYNDLHKISETAGGKYFHASDPNNLGAAFENAVKDLYEMGLNSAKKGIYTFDIPEEFRPEDVVNFTGKTATSKGENKPVEIRIVDLTSQKEVYRTKSNPDGSFYFVLSPGKIYGYHVEDSAFYPTSDHIDLRDVNTATNITKNIPLIPFDEIIENNVAITLKNLFFDFDRSDILPISIPELKLHAKIIKSANCRVEISGYTDNTGSEAYNRNLSQRRADAVREYLIREGCNSEKLNAVGYGIRRIDSNETEEGRASNRRVELIFKKK